MAGWFKSIFSDGPETKFKQASDAIANWWDSIEGVQHFDDTIATDIVATVILCPSPEAMRMEYKVRHGAVMPLEASGMTWSDGTRWEIYLPYKETQAGNTVVNEWALGHEIAHCLPISNPDGVDKPEFYNV